MHQIQAKKLTVQDFAPYGSYMDILNPDGSSLGDFYNDKVLYHVSGNMPIGFSTLICRKPEQKVVTKAEYHNTTGEAMLVLDDDVILHVAPPTGEPCPERTEAFLVPMGTLIAIKTGVWHMGVMPINKKEAHVLIILPERVYKNDCSVAEYEEGDFIEIL